MAPSPTGLLHLGHARTFWTAYQRTPDSRGTLIFRNEDPDPQRSKAEFAAAMIEDLRWLGIRGRKGPTSPGHSRPTSKAGAATSIWTLGGSPAMAEPFIRARARGKSLPFRCCSQ